MNTHLPRCPRPKPPKRERRRSQAPRPRPPQWPGQACPSLWRPRLPPAETRSGRQLPRWPARLSVGARIGRRPIRNWSGCPRKPCSSRQSMRLQLPCFKAPVCWRRARLALGRPLRSGCPVLGQSSPQAARQVERLRGGRSRSCCCCCRLRTLWRGKIILAPAVWREDARARKCGRTGT